MRQCSKCIRLAKTIDYRLHRALFSWLPTTIANLPIVNRVENSIIDDAKLRLVPASFVRCFACYRRGMIGVLYFVQYTHRIESGLGAICFVCLDCSNQRRTITFRSNNVSNVKSTDKNRNFNVFCHTLAISKHQLATAKEGNETNVPKIALQSMYGDLHMRHYCTMQSMG